MKKQILLLLFLISASNILFASKSSLSALFNACCWGEVEVIKEYINSCFNVNIQDQHERALIHCAVSNGHLEIVKILINAGADLEVKDRNDATALHYAVRFGFIDIVEYLLQHGASIQSQSMYGDTPLHNAVEYAEYINIVKVLIDAGSDLNALDYHGNTPLYYALYHKNTEAMELLLNAGANPFLFNEDLDTIFDQLDSMDQRDRLDCKEIIIFFFKHMNYEKYRKQFNISHQGYLKAWNIVCSKNNREILIRYADEVTSNNPTHPFQCLVGVRKSLFK
jgi:ankyrin repeat protein